MDEVNLTSHHTWRKSSRQLIISKKSRITLLQCESLATFSNPKRSAHIFICATLKEFSNVFVCMCVYVCVYITIMKREVMQLRWSEGLTGRIGGRRGRR